MSNHIAVKLKPKRPHLNPDKQCLQQEELRCGDYNNSGSSTISRCELLGSLSRVGMCWRKMADC